MPRTVGAESSSTGDAPTDATAALADALSALRERVAVVDQIVASSPSMEPRRQAAASRGDPQTPATPPMHTPRGSPAETPMATPMEAPPGEQDVRIQTTVLSDADIAEMVAQGVPPTAPTSAQKLRGLGAKLAGSLVALSPARASTAHVQTSNRTENDDASPTEHLRLENCRERGLPATATWNDIADYDMALSPKDIEERRKDTVGRLLRLATAPQDSERNEIEPREETKAELEQAGVPEAPRENQTPPEPSQSSSESELSQLLDGFQVLALASPAALPSVATDSQSEAQTTPESRTPSCVDTRGSSDSFGSVQSGSFLNESCSPVGGQPVRRAGAGRRRGGSIDAALAMLPGTPREYDNEDDFEDYDDEGDGVEEEEQTDQAHSAPERSCETDHMDISLHSIFPPPEQGTHHDASSISLSPGMVAAQCVLDGDHIGAQKALAKVVGSASGDKALSGFEAGASAAALEDSFTMAEAEAMRQAEESFNAKHAELLDSFSAAEAEADKSLCDKSPADAVCSAFGDDFGQLLAEARRLVGTGQRIDSPVPATESPQQLGSPHSRVETTGDTGVPAPASTSPSTGANDAGEQDAPIGPAEVDEAHASASNPALRVGESCEVVLQGKCETGTVCFLGPAPLLGIGEWVGIKLDRPCGKHDGAVQGKRYFKCKARHGILLKKERVKASPEPLGVAEGPVTRSRTAAKVASTTNRFIQRASEQVQAAASDPTSPLHATDADFSDLVAEARQLAGEVELSDLRRSTIQSPAAAPSQLSAKKQGTRARTTRRRSSVDAAAAPAAAAAAAAAEAVAMTTPEYAAEAEAELYLLKRKLRVLWKDMGRQSLRRVLKRSCPSGDVQFDDFLQSLRIGGHINAKLLSDLELRRLFRGAKLESCDPGTTVSTHDITPVTVDALVSFLGLESTHAELKQKVADATGTSAEATATHGDEIDFTALLREAREVIGAIPVVKSPPTTTATVVTAVATTAAVRSGKPRATATATATARIAARNGTDEPTSACTSVDHSRPKQKQPRRPLSAPKQRYVPSPARLDGRASSTARARGPIRSRTPDARTRPASSTRAASNSRGRRASSASSRPRPSTAPAPQVAIQADATQATMIEERGLDASPKELSYAERALADAQRRQAWRDKQQEAQQERARTVASGRPGGKPVRKRTPAAQARFLEQMDQNDQARKQRLSEMREEASRTVKVKILKCVGGSFPTPPLHAHVSPLGVTIAIEPAVLTMLTFFWTLVGRSPRSRHPQKRSLQSRLMILMVNAGGQQEIFCRGRTS